MNSDKPPPAPNPQAVIGEQTAANKNTAITQQNLNMVDQKNPYGSLSYNQTGTNADGTPKYTATTSLTPQQQGLFDVYQKIQGQGYNNVSNSVSQPFDLNASAGTQQSDIQRRLLDPVWAMRDQQQDTKLRNQGVVPGTEAYDNAMRTYGMQRDNSYDSNLLASRGQAVSEALAQRNQPLTEMGAITGAAPQQPNFINTPQVGVGNTNVAGIYNDNYQNQLSGYNASKSTQNAMLGGLFGLGGAALGGWARGGFATGSRTA
jgi:hypothetical protein